MCEDLPAAVVEAMISTLLFQSYFMSFHFATLLILNLSVMRMLGKVNAEGVRFVMLFLKVLVLTPATPELCTDDRTEKRG